MIQLELFIYDEVQFHDQQIKFVKSLSAINSVEFIEYPTVI